MSNFSYDVHWLNSPGYLTAEVPSAAEGQGQQEQQQQQRRHIKACVAQDLGRKKED